MTPNTVNGISISGVFYAAKEHLSSSSSASDRIFGDLIKFREFQRISRHFPYDDISDVIITVEGRSLFEN